MIDFIIGFGFGMIAAVVFLNGGKWIKKYQNKKSEKLEKHAYDVSKWS